MKSPKCVAKKNEVKIAKKKGGEIAERKRKDWCLEILLSAHVSGSEGRVWLNLFVCFSRIINEISIGSSLGRKGRDDFRYVACCRYQ